MAAINRLNDRQVRSHVTQGNPKFIGDGNGLYLRVTAPGSASWFFRVKSNGKIIQKSIGPLSGWTLANARKKAAAMMIALAEGRNPVDELKPKHDPSALTFADYAADYIAGKKTEHRSLKAHAQWTSTLKDYCGQIAHMRPADIQYRDIELIISQPKLSSKRETQSRVLQRLRNIMDYAAKREGQPGRFNPALAVRLPKRKGEQAPKNFAAAPYSDVPAILTALREKDTISALALRFTIATAARSMNVRDCLWSEIDLENALLAIPGEKMKGGLPFRQPLNADALEALELAKAKTGKSRRVFPGPIGGLISDVAINKTLALAVRDAGLDMKVTAHGFRASFRMWGAEQTQYPAEALELCLAHKQTNKVAAAYQRSDLLEIRTQIMAAWANYCSNISNIIELAKSKAGN